jgi:hypothetical protein
MADERALVALPAVERVPRSSVGDATAGGLDVLYRADDLARLEDAQRVTG